MNRCKDQIMHIQMGYKELQSKDIQENEINCKWNHVHKKEKQEYGKMDGIDVCVGNGYCQ